MREANDYIRLIETQLSEIAQNNSTQSSAQSSIHSMEIQSTSSIFSVHSDQSSSSSSSKYSVPCYSVSSDSSEDAIFEPTPHVRMAEQLPVTPEVRHEFYVCE
jgi:hypothetical protein